MNSTNAKDYLPLVQALAEGKVIQISSGEGHWADISDPNFGSHASDYRIKPDPREIWVNEYQDFPSAIHATEAAAKAHLMQEGGVTRRYREVIE